jgi:hypothetical protein
VTDKRRAIFVMTRADADAFGSELVRVVERHATTKPGHVAVKVEGRCLDAVPEGAPLPVWYCAANGTLWRLAPDAHLIAAEGDGQ